MDTVVLIVVQQEGGILIVVFPVFVADISFLFPLNRRRIDSEVRPHIHDKMEMPVGNRKTIPFYHNKQKNQENP